MVDRLITCGLDVTRDDPDLVRRIRAVAAGLMFMAGLGAVYAALFAYVGIGILLLSSAIIAITSLGLWAMLFKVRSPELAGHLLITVFFAHIAVWGMTNGGIHSTSMFGLFVIPVGAAVLLSWRACVLWGAAVAALYVGLWAYEFSGGTIPVLLSGELLAWQDLINGLATAVGVVFLTALFVKSHTGVANELRKALRIAQQESEVVEILSAAATAANEVATVHDALARTLQSVCETKGWVGALATRIDPVTSRNGGSGEAYYLAPGLEAAERLQMAQALRVAAARAAESGDDPVGDKPVFIDLEAEEATSRALAREFGIRGQLCARLAIGAELWIVDFFAQHLIERDASTHNLLYSIGTQLGRVWEREETNSRIHDLAYFDRLTGLPNRLHFNVELFSLMKQHEYAGQRTALLRIGIDRFKNVNDALGPQVGDQVLREVADSLKECLRQADMPTVAAEQSPRSRHLFRIGGDEFAAVLGWVDEASEMSSLAQRVLDHVSRPLEIYGREVYVTAGIGLAISGADGADPSDLMKAADSALSSAKRAGGNRFEFYSEELNQANSRRLDLEAKLRRAIARNELSLHYQPFINGTTGAIEGAEALLRWTTVDGERVSPAEFIPIAESTGLIESIGSWVLRTAASQLASWRTGGIDGLRIAVNLSVDQLRDQSFTQMVNAVLSANRLAPSDIELEVTETRLIQRRAGVIKTLEDLRAAGVPLSLDDFGTGYSSFAQLRQLPIDRLKIDRSFINEIESDASAHALVAGMVKMARDLGLRVIAEGVETEAQSKALIEIGCDEMQGYYFSRPIPPEEFERLVRGSAPTVQQTTRVPGLLN